MTANKKIALIGGIASGKTAVSDILSEMGATIIDADVISRKVIAEGTDGEKILIREFPSCVVNNSIDRKKLRALIFSDNEQRIKLNQITHPLIIDEINRQLKNTKGVRVVVMPLPTGLEVFDTVLNVYVPKEQRIQRLKLRDNITDDDACAIMATQWSDQKMISAADYTLINSGTKDELKSEVGKWWNVYVKN